MAVVSDTTRTLLVIGGSPAIDWLAVFADAELPSGERVRTIWSTWEELSLVSYGDSSRVIVSSSKTKTTFTPDFLLIRGAAKGAYTTNQHSLLIRISLAQEYMARITEIFCTDSRMLECHL